jgi:hypothetical protein
MSEELALVSAHPVGESVLKAGEPCAAWPVDTAGGRYFAEWDTGTPVTREGQLIFFAQFLKTGGRWEEFLRGCPLHYTGNRGSGPINVMGTAMLSILCGHWRYAHINSVRGDSVNPGLLGMDHTVSEDVVRGALRRIDEAEGLAWLGGELRACIEPVLNQPWIMDIDTTVKPLYGHQQGAEIGYNPHKPGRPSHCYHSYFVANLRLCLGVDVASGKDSAAIHGMPGLWRLLDELPRTCWPTFLRGDSGYGNERLINEAEARDLPYFFKLRHTPKVKTLVQRLMREGARWQATGDGWEVIESSIKLTGWTRERRVVLVREAPAIAPVGGNSRRRGRDLAQPTLAGGKAVPGSGWEAKATPWSGKIAVLVTSLDVVAFPALCMARLYRERADAENIYDELKNQWGWNGYTTKKLSPCRLMANLVALIYNWWNLYVRFFDEEHHREAITSRPALLGGVARQTQHGGQRTIRVSIMHEKGDAIVQAVTLISNYLHRTNLITERWSIAQRWALLLTRILRRWLGGKWLPGIPPEAFPLLSG